MTRESRARWLAFTTALLVVLLAATFAWLRNLAPAPTTAQGGYGRAPDATSAAGRAAFVRLGCSACHAAEGRGNPTLPLDGVGARLPAEELRAAAFGVGAAGARLPAAVAERKRAVANDADSDALIRYLSALK